jgi:hypothetical protein
LAFIRYFLPEEVKYLLQIDLERKVKDFSKDDQILLQEFLGSFAKTKLFLQQTNLWTSNSWFGSIARKEENLSKYFKVRVLKKKIKKTQRKRGYHDHGSVRPSHKWKPSSDWTLTAEQNRLESEEETLKDTLAFIEGMII